MSTIAFGEKRLRDRPIKNPSLSIEQREYEGEFGIFLQQAKWLIRSDNSIICTSDDSNEIGGPMLTGLHRIVGSRVISGKTILGSNDFQLVFDNLISIEVRCVEQDDEPDSYSMFYLGTEWMTA